MRREVFFVPNEELFVEARIAILDAEKVGTRAHLEASLFAWISCYSRGDEMAALQQQYLDMVVPALNAVEESGEGSGYDIAQMADYQVCLALVSLNILLGGDTDPIAIDPIAIGLKRIRSVFQVEGKDIFLDCLCAVSLPEIEIAEEMLHPMPYKDLLGAINEKQPLQQRNAVLRFLRKYYPSLTPVSWYDSHLDLNDAFFGYWAFELAAVVKLFGLDDRPFADNIFYPRDLVHEPMFRTWLETGFGDYQKRQLEKLQKAWQKEADAQIGAVNSEVANLQNSLRSFVEDVMKGTMGQQVGNQDPTQKLKRSADSLRLLSDLSGLDAKELDRNPAMAKTLILSMLQTVSSASLKASKSGPEDMKAMQAAMGEAAEKLANEEGIDLKALEDELPAEVQARLAELTKEEGKVAYRHKMRNFSEAVESLVENDQLEEEELLASLEQLALQYGFKDPELSISEKVKADLDKKWEEIRKDKKMIDFSFDDIYNS